MPVSFNLRVSINRKINIEELNPERIHALFFSFLPESMAKSLHADNIKPFSLSYQRFFNSNKEREIGSFILKISFLKEKMFPLFVKEVSKAGKDKNVVIGKAKVVKTKISSVNYISYAELLNNAGYEKDIVFQVITPATFKKGKYDNPSPVPSLIFKSLFRKWNHFSRLKLPISETEFIKLVKRHVLTSGLWIKTEKVFISLSFKKLIGFKGRLYFYIDTDNKQLLKVLNALSDFSEFSGIGRKTTMGFGRIKRINS
ncbi:CRISPR system precrRNA processing endoribonuclease RAMP protein Cas6 [Desulfurobacterium atlanticum]|uniref:CRISPR-associated endoribonuclease Cas6 n=1 Tax=Desulfurobacterium atlanticum TaxID=240169 RepID=A0A238XX61_9BACT|nr:CRISPR system precrRNA processing endoribonuclease RAMP protein Cas6 [Desulfurobacterium atlanticum]SNR63023.1 CRISPR-associated endoribonuclease Cas6 [Desulfurobacterium atlanticum]